MASAPQNFFCDSCSQTILATNPRVHCLNCRDYDLCANCAIAERFTHGHIALHLTQVFKESGGTTHYPVPSSCTIVYIPQSSSTPNQPITTHGGQPPHQTPPPSAGLGWQPFFRPDMTPTPTYTTLMNDIFSYLDPQNTGVLLPETFSRFLDDMGYLPHENAWKAGLNATFNQSAESNADKTLKNAFDLFSIDHQLLQRIQGPHADPTGLTQTLRGVLGGAFPLSTREPAPPMPAITRKGFVDITVIEVLCDPSREWGNLSRMLRKYNLARYSGWGDLPRNTIPAMPDQAMLDRVAGVTAFSKQKGERELEQARMNAQIRARGNQIAVDLLDGTRREYRYVY